MSVRYQGNVSMWISAPLTLLFREMCSAERRMASFLEVSSDLSVSRPLVNTSLRDVYAAERLALDSSASKYPAANSWLRELRRGEQGIP